MWVVGGAGPDCGVGPAAAGTLEFLNAWLTSDRDQLDASLHRYVGHPTYNIDRLKTDLARFTFLLGGDTDGELFQPPRDRTGHDQLDKDYLHNAAERAVALPGGLSSGADVVQVLFSGDGEVDPSVRISAGHLLGQLGVAGEVEPAAR
jgi:hypothetical protein